MYLDSNNLYGWAMVYHLPTRCFKCSFTSTEDILKHPINNKVGYYAK